MTRDQVIARLNELPNAEVQITWEGIFKTLEPDSFYMSKDGILIIDADSNFYKDQIIKVGVNDL